MSHVFLCFFVSMILLELVGLDSLNLASRPKNGGLAQLVTSLVAPTTLLNAGSG